MKKELERARWRCRRGLLELDILLGRFMDAHYATLGENELQQFEILLSLPDNDLWDMIMQKQQAKDQSLQPVLRLLQAV
jgi:antitoxin CptB